MRRLTCTMNSVLSLLDASCSDSLRAESRASISSKNMTEGWCDRARENKACHRYRKERIG